MAREVIIKEWCDVCLANDIRVEGIPTPPIVPSTHNAAKPRVIALCPAHEADLWEPLRAALVAHGQAPEAPGSEVAPKPSRSHHGGGMGARSIDGPFVCEAPDCNAIRPAKNLASLTVHLLKRHGMTLNAYRETYGPPKRPDGTRAPTWDGKRWVESPSGQVPTPHPSDLACPVPGCDYSAEGRKNTGMALTSHRRRSHPELYAADLARGGADDDPSSSVA